MWQPGQRIGDYELVAQLGSGGMATLFLGRRIGAAGFTREVALKIIHPQFADDEQFRQMFLDEAMLASRVKHPNVVHVEALGDHAGTHFLVMEYVHGCSLSQLQRALLGRGRRLAPAFAVRIAMLVADALHAAHETCDEHGRLLNMVHRDVSPENVLLAYAGHVKLIDFGIAKAYGRRHRTQDGLLKGKFRYMAPEQAYSKDIDRRTDLYQLGIVLWEMLTLRRLFDAETDVELLQQVREPRIVAPSTLVAHIPAALEAALLSALDPDPTRRPDDARAFARMLGKAIPEALEVDSGALSALVMVTMQEHRAREQGTLPPLVYERLERGVQTERLGSDAPQPRAGLSQHTVEHAAPYGGEAPDQAAARADGAGAPQGRARRRTAAEYGSPALAPPAAPSGFGQGGPVARRRRLVRMASEIKTTITRMTDSARGRPWLFWLTGAFAIGLAVVAAPMTVTLRAPPTPPPRVSARPATSAIVAVGGADDAMPSSALAPFAPATAPAGDAGAVADPALQGRQLPGAPSPRAPGETSRARLPPPVTVDGTPIILEPGF